MFKDMKIRNNVHAAHNKANFSKAKHKITSADRRPC